MADEDSAVDAQSLSTLDSDDPRHPSQQLGADSRTIRTSAPKFKIGYGTVMGLIANRMIGMFLKLTSYLQAPAKLAGSGIFVNAGLILKLTNSTGVTLLLWLAGVAYAIAGITVYIEYGLSVPRRKINGSKIAIPRSGGDLNYLSYVYRFVAYAKDTVMLVPTIYGVCFVVFGTMAGNAMNCAIQLLRASQPDINIVESNSTVRGIAIAISILACSVHTSSRRGGLLLNNAFALVKIGMLLLIIIATIAYHAGGFKAMVRTHDGSLFSNIPTRSETLDRNFNPQKSFSGASGNAYAYASAFLHVIFTFSGFDQVNYVLGEVKNPRRTFPIGLNLAVAGISFLYLAVNICYWTVVPSYMFDDSDQRLVNHDKSIAEAFFVLTFGSLSDDPQRLGGRIACTFTGLSAMGNVIVMTYTATRVKQEIAKEGILPFPKFFASNYDLSIGRLMRWISGPKRSGRSGLLRAGNFQEKTPVGATVLHLLTCVLLVFGTWTLEPLQAYQLLTGTASYLITAFFGALLSLGLLYLRLRSSLNWKEKAPRLSTGVSVIAATIYLVLNLFPVALKWYPLHGQGPEELKWFLVPTLAWIMLAIGALWWFAFFSFQRRKDRRTNTVLSIEKRPEYKEEPRGSGQLVQTHETTFISREARDFVDKKLRGPGLGDHRA